MKTKQQFKLIDGDFSAQESFEVLQNVFSSKIQFHQMKNFSSQERFGHNDETAMIRIPQLKESLATIEKMMQFAENEALNIEIKSEIAICFIPKP
jgi:hypothetical protein